MNRPTTIQLAIILAGSICVLAWGGWRAIMGG